MEVPQHIIYNRYAHLRLGDETTHTLHHWVNFFPELLHTYNLKLIRALEVGSGVTFCEGTGSTILGDKTNACMP